jgi:hypothetical protein
VREFELSGALEELLDRCQLEGGEPLRDEAAAAYRGLKKLELQYLRSMVRGVGMGTIWERTRS